MKNKHQGAKEMETEISPAARRTKEPGFWREMWQHSRLVMRLMRDREVPFYLKILPVAGLGYALFPFDLLPDLMPVIGQLDDVTALLVSSKLFIELAPPSVVARHLQSIRESDGYVAFVPEDSPSLTSADDELAQAIIIDVEHEVVVEKNEEAP